MTIAELLNPKEAKNSFEFDTLVKCACAVSNHGGGRVVFGITDKRPRKVVGSQAFEQPERTRKGFIDKLHVRVDFELFQQEGKRVLVFVIAGRPIGLPIQADGIAWWRDGDSLVKMPQEIQHQIFAESGHDFSGDICPQATIEDLDLQTFYSIRRDKPSKWRISQTSPSNR